MKWVRQVALLFAILCTGLALLGQFSMALVSMEHAQIQVEWGSILVYWQPNSFGSWSASFLPPMGSIFDKISVGYRVQALNMYGNPAGRLTYLGAPHWLTNLIAWSLVIILRRKARTYPEGHCQSCGYDLTGNDCGTCPECHAPISDPNLTA